MNWGELGLWVVVGTATAGITRPGQRVRVDLAAPMAATALLVGLGWLFVIEAWGWAYVADHARPGTNGVLRLAGLWAGPEGSLLLWLTLVSLAAAAAGALADRPTRAAVRGVGSAATAAYGLVLVLAASPFERLPSPANGGLGLQPVLEHPAMVWHPPLLYGGLVGLLVPFFLAVGASITTRWRPEATRPTMATAVPAVAITTPLALLTAGLASGALWANVELGWGGFWAWDPIESAGLVAWLAGLAALHALQPDVAGSRTGAGLLVLPGLAAVGATTLTRSGAVASVHTFAERPALRLGLLLVAAGMFGLGAMAPTWTKSSEAAKPGTPIGPSVGDQPLDRQATTPSRGAAGRRLAVAVLITATVFVAIGTYEPAIEAATTGDRSAIAGRYYTRLLWPVVLTGAVMAVRADRRWGAAGVGAVAGLVLTPFAAGPFALAVGAAGGAVAGAAIGQVGRRPGALAHLGIGLALVGIAGTIATTSTTLTAPLDRPVSAASRTIVHRGVELTDSPGSRVATAEVEVDGVAYRPRLVNFPLRSVSTIEMDRRRDGIDEIQVLLLDGGADSARYRVIHLPRLHLVWLGSALIALGLSGQVRRRLRSSSSDTVDAPPPDGSSSAGDDGVAAWPPVGEAEAGVGVGSGGLVGVATAGGEVEDGAVPRDDGDGEGDDGSERVGDRD